MRRLFSSSSSAKRKQRKDNHDDDSSADGKIKTVLSKEIIRKLELATQAEQKEDRDIVCSEVFADITGTLNAAARESTGHSDANTRWYEVLAPFFSIHPSTGDELLSVCKKLWGQPFTAPIFALLLHQWLLDHPDAGGADERLKHLNILISGARQLFLGDLETASMAFEPLYTFILRMILTHEQVEENLVGLSVSFIPYYVQEDGEFSRILDELNEKGGEDLIDFVIVRIVDALAKDIRADQACMQYLYRLKLVGKFIDMLRTSTRIRLQGTIYSLTQPGGPRYASRKVNRLAFSVLDILFPHGKRTRRMINFGFRFLFAQEWPWVWWDACCALFSSISVGLAYVLSVLVFVQQRILRWCRRRVS